MFIRLRFVVLVLACFCVFRIHGFGLSLVHADTIEITGTIRDFNAGNPPDFEQDFYCGQITGLVDSTLGSDSKPVFGPNGTECITSAETFAQWYNDVPGVNLSTSYTITLDNGTTTAGGTYIYENTAFFPIDDQLLGNEGGDHNYHFTYELHAEFTYAGGETFTFSSDDDLWVFINDNLVVDLGGVHETVTGSVDLDTLGLTIGENYNFDLFFAERHSIGSVFKMVQSVKPSITSFSPTAATTGETVIITGTNFSGVTGVRFGEIAASSFTIDSDTQITAVVGFGSSGDVSVSTPGWTTSLSGFTYILSCEASGLDAGSKVIELKKEEEAVETITVTCNDDTGVAGTIVTAKVVSGKNCVSVSPASAVTDTSGKAEFAVKAKKKTGTAKIKFKGEGLKDKVKVKVKK